MKSLFILFIIALPFFSNGQTLEQREVIKASMRKIVARSGNEIKTISQEKEKRIETFLKNHPDQKKTYTKDGKTYSLYNVTKDGHPIYVTTKDIRQVNNSKANSLYSRGSIGTNITGTDMVVGVWDGGQVNASHELIAGQATMQSGQTLNGPEGNDHQTAVTGIMIGKNINAAQGIAFNAKSQNYDWDKDLLEMDSFSSNGFLVSNHSYGYANDNTLPTWLFGAYNSESQAWDFLLQTKPFYLPFVACGNEQQSNGNSSAGGFDLMTGSATSKNVLTVGAVNSDNSMTNYSNWGPTDDGRIKPDIVTLGTSINVPLYTNNTGYSGNVSESSGTSFSSPAVAAGALLLQQYYYSLNRVYMKASLLKALLLHSADDDASNNGPDPKFGWGILNLEKAANIIKQNSTTGGTAKMLMISANPANNGTDEIVNNFVFGNSGVRSSLCWVDDYGSEQTGEDGVNNTRNRMVYNFSIKLEQNTPALIAFPYNNLSVTNPGNPAVAGNGYFQTANNYIQANLSGTTDSANGKVTIRKSSSSPSAAREVALIITGLKANPLSLSELNSNQNIMFFDKSSNKIKLFSNGNKLIKNYQIYAADGKVVLSGIANSTEIDFTLNSKNIFIIKYIVDDTTYDFKFAN